MKCRECNLVFESRTELNHHVIQKHGTDDIECEQCGKYFVTRNELSQHRKNHKNINHDIEALNANLQRLLNDDEVGVKDKEDKDEQKIVKCNQCDEEFVTKTSLKNHEKRRHETYQKKIKQKFEEPVRSSERYVHISKLKCNLCEMRFLNLDRMDDHMDAEHGGRWKLFDQEVIQLGEEYQESDFDDSSCSEELNNSDDESSETQSGEELS